MYQVHTFMRWQGEQCMCNCHQKIMSQAWLESCSRPCMARGMQLRTGSVSIGSSWQMKPGFKHVWVHLVCFWHSERNIRCVVHGDDFTLLGSQDQLMWFREQLKKRFQVKLRGMLGPSSKDDKEITILNRTVSWDKNGITYKVDPRHVDIVIQ